MSEEKRGCLGFLFALLQQSPREQATGPALPKAQVNKYFVSDAEAEFFRLLRRVVGEHGHVLAQVSLRQLVWFPGNNQSNPGRASWQNKVAAKSVDFVVCDPASLRPLVAIELDEPSHAKADRQTRDDEVDAVLGAAGLGLLRVLTSRTYNTRELADALAPYVPALATGRQKQST